MKIILDFGDGNTRVYYCPPPLLNGLSSITYCHPRDGEIMIACLEAGQVIPPSDWVGFK